MVVYEQYASPAEKRVAQQGAKRGKPTGKARGYIFVYDELGSWMGAGGVINVDGVACVYDVAPGGRPNHMGSTPVGLVFLRQNCRRIGGCHLPPAWKKKWEYYRKED